MGTSAGSQKQPWDFDGAASMTDNAKELLALDVDALAQEIRRVDGSNSFGAGALAEALIPFIVSRLSARQQASARNLANAILDAPVGSATAMARALLAKYDIFEKVKG
jgi:hypothetical protein